MRPDYFLDLVERLHARLAGSEILFSTLTAERSDFARLTQARIRQAGHVHASGLALTLISGAKQAQAVCDLSGQLDLDLRAASGLLESLRERIGFVPDDPYLSFSPDPIEHLTEVGVELPAAPEMLDAVLESASGLDLVGIWASGELAEGLASSLGHRCWHRSRSFNLDWSCYLRADKAVKSSYSGLAWDPEVLPAKMERMRRSLEVMARPARTIEPGRYRAYLAPAAVHELMEMLAWGGFGLKDHRTLQTPLLKLVRGERAFATAVTLREEHSRGLVPGVTPEGFAKPESVVLIDAGGYRDCLVDARSGKEYGVPVNAASDMPESLCLAPGELAPDAVLGRLGSGLLIGNLWYCNWSDINDCRVTGMTRFGTFWVEGGEIVAPVEVMRFDDSLYDLLGDRLEALTLEPELLVSADTYEGRSAASALLPGALVSGLDLTL